MKRRAEFRQLFLPISITLFATVVTVSIVFAFFTNRTLVRTVYESEARNLENAGEATELRIRRAATTRRVLLAISIIFLLVSLVAAFLLSRRVFVPVSDALERFEHLEQQTEASQEVVNRQLLYSFLLQPGAGRES